MVEPRISIKAQMFFKKTNWQKSVQLKLHRVILENTALQHKEYHDVQTMVTKLSRRRTCRNFD